MFADDTSIFLAHDNPSELISILNEDLKRIDSWMNTNKLSVNIKKTNYVIFKPRQKCFHHSRTLLYNNIPLEQKKSLKFLGVFIDENRSLKTHIDYICNKVSKSIGIIYKSRFFLSSKTKLSLYYSLIYPYLHYCNIIWSSTYPSNLNRIFLLQKRIVRIIAKTH